MPKSTTAPRHAQRGLIALALLAAAALLGVTVTTSALLARSAHTVELAQGEAMAGIIHSATRPYARPQEQTDLDALLEQHRAQGMRALLMYDRTGAVARVSGEGGPWPPSPPAFESQQLDDTRRWRVVRMPAKHDGAPHGAPRERRPPPGERGPRGPRAEVVVIVEYAPDDALRLRRAGTTLEVAGGLASLLLVLGAWLLGRASRRAELARANEQQAAHMAHVGQMSATLAHEIRTPLTALKGHAQLLEATLERGSPAHKKAGRVVEQADRLEQLIEGLLAFVRSGRVAPAMDDPRVVVRRAASLAGVEALMSEEGEVGRWPLDAARLEQAARNLLENAAREGAGGPVEVRLRQQGELLRIEVGDRGPGVSDEVLARLGEAFFTTRATGTGLGLAVADSVARAHGGWLEASNREGGGAWFVLVLGRQAGGQ